MGLRNTERIYENVNDLPPPSPFGYVPARIGENFKGILKRGKSYSIIPENMFFVLDDHLHLKDFRKFAN